MNKTELINILAKKTEMEPIKVKLMVNAFCDTVMYEVKRGNRVQLNGFGAFELRKRQAKKGRNPHTGEELVIPERTAPFFKPSKEFRK